MPYKYFFVKLVQYNEYSVSIIDTDGQVLYTRASIAILLSYNFMFPAVYGLNVSGFKTYQ